MAGLAGGRLALLADRGLFAMDIELYVAHSSAMDPEDLRDIDATLSGDSAAYACLIDRYQNVIAKRMWRFTRDRVSLDELVHEVFVEAYMSLRGFKRVAPFLHWLNRIATRVGYRFWKKQKRDALLAVPLQDWDGVVDPNADALEAAEAAETVHCLLAQLRPRDRLVLTLMYIEELSVANVAEQTGWSKTMVKVQAHRARKKLKKLIADTEDDLSK